MEPLFFSDDMILTDFRLALRISSAVYIYQFWPFLEDWEEILILFPDKLQSYSYGLKVWSRQYFCVQTRNHSCIDSKTTRCCSLYPVEFKFKSYTCQLKCCCHAINIVVGNFNYHFWWLCTFKSITTTTK